MALTSVINLGENCWRKEAAMRVALLIDGENYYSALHAAIQKAQRTIFILGWDFDTRISLIRDDDNNPNLPSALGPFIREVLNKNPDLEVYILNWDWAMVYTLEREWLPLNNPQWQNSSRLFFELDGECPAGSSQHQKVVVIDDHIAFAGGFDLGRSRWDSSEHKANDPRRKNPDNKPYPPFHDIQMLVEGEIAKALGDLCRERWFRVTGDNLPSPQIDDDKSPWPNGLSPWFEDIDVAIARTFPDFKDYPEIREVERLYQDAIAAADSLIYIENQYFSSWHIAELIQQRLQEPNGPDVVIVLPLMTGGWLEQATMDVLRFRVVDKLRQTDVHNRLRTCYPHRDELGDEYISVHAKIAVFDDALMRVGSANLSNRSMGFDSECDLAIEASNDKEKGTIKRFRECLVSEHLGINHDELCQFLSEMSLIDLIDKRQDLAHTLRKLDCNVPEHANELLPSSALVDPEKAMNAEQLKALFISSEEQTPAKKQWWQLLLILTLAITMTVVWRYTPLNDWFNLEIMQAAIEQLKAYPFTPIIVLILFAVAAVLAFPVTLLIITTALAFGPVWGSLYAIIGSFLSAALGYCIGHYMGKKSLENIAGSTINKLSHRLSEHGLLAVITVRIVPVAPFTVINLIAGASHIKVRDFLIGSFIGMLPGILAVTVFADSLMKMIANPAPEQIAIFIMVVILAILLMIGLKKIIKHNKA